MCVCVCVCVCVFIEKTGLKKGERMCVCVCVCVCDADLTSSDGVTTYGGLNTNTSTLCSRPRPVHCLEGLEELSC